MSTNEIDDDLVDSDSHEDITELSMNFPQFCLAKISRKMKPTFILL